MRVTSRSAESSNSIPVVPPVSALLVVSADGEGGPIRGGSGGITSACGRNADVELGGPELSATGDGTTPADGSKSGRRSTTVTGRGRGSAAGGGTISMMAVSRERPKSSLAARETKPHSPQKITSSDIGEPHCSQATVAAPSNLGTTSGGIGF